jgi:hypothetical protein
MEKTSTGTNIRNGLIGATRARKIRDSLLERAAMSLLKQVTIGAAQGKLETDMVEINGYCVKHLQDLAGEDLKHGAKQWLYWNAR